ncbi:MAG TPA: hypothetical protein VN914_08610 [Polyangia bacterium]|nr:hypothetical protein [Polyangia bacterium]
MRRGLAIAINRDDVTPPPSQPGPSLTAVDLNLEFNSSENAATKLTLVGPGDIVGLDPRTVIRTFPRADVNDADVGFFAMIEFDQPDLPWRYTPARAVGNAAQSTDKLRPWFNLIVLEEGTELTEDRIKPSGADRKLPQITVQQKFLPNLSESWAFAHTQIKGAPPSDGFKGSDLTAPGAALARVMAPRSLKIQTAYRALLVPTFERGRMIGTGVAPGNTDALKLAWGEAGPDDDVDLPVYYQWRFQTGTTGTFKDLALALKPKKNLDETIGTRKLDVSDPGLRLTSPVDPPTDPLKMGGALQSLAAKNLPAPTFTDGWKNGLAAFISDPKLPDGADFRKVVAPPMYGRWYAKDDKLNQASNPPWFYQLNVDPRHRVGAALGTEVIQRDQEALMESAWEQAKSLVLINEQRAWWQVGRAVWKTLILRHIGKGLVENVLGMTSFLHPRVRVGTKTVFAKVRESALGAAMFEPSWRRFTSAQGTIGRKLGLHRLPTGTPFNLFDRINEGKFQPAPPPGTPRLLPTPVTAFDPAIPGGIEDRQVETLVSRLTKEALNFWGQVLFWTGRNALIAEGGKFFWLAHKVMRLGLGLIKLAADPQRKNEILLEKWRKDTLTPTEIEQGPGVPSFTPVDELPDLGGTGVPPPSAPPGSGADNTNAAFWRRGLVELWKKLTFPIKELPLFEPIDLNPTITDLLNAFDPEKTFVAASKARHFVALDVPWANTDFLEPIQAAPVFSQPMYLPLKDISPEWILPGVGQLERNTVSAVITNQRFIEAYMVGLNHEMTRELLWREYPIDQRGTYFQQFWDARGWVNGSNVANPPDLRDIKEVRLFDGKDLGQNSARPSTLPSNFLVLLVRGDLIKRYPNVIVYAAKAGTPGQPRKPDDTKQEHPILHGFLGTDIAFYGFPFTPDDARGAGDNAGWYVIFQEQPGEPRFETPDEDGTLLTVDEIRAAKGDLQASGAIAAATFDVPTRVAIHGAEFVPDSV